MKRQARREGFFVQVPAPGLNGKVEQVVMMRCPPTACDSLRLVYLACIYLGAKVGDRVRYTGQLSSMLKAAVVELETNVLKGLDWRLGPFFDLGPDGGF
ncbi:hypothetical protein C2E21_7576 isoform B [Chlorella sorokiniana]|nr:hypothetical protein C2E21_7576 isoform B [Chlorella sorokiniana]|eukprot:PRW33739.1 hypothetical protein C2E21_7576 isoform B [Chlorella sorokiniana]